MTSLSVSRDQQYLWGPATALDLCIPAPHVSPDTDNATVLQLFSKNKELVSLPVVEDGRPFGLISRHIFMSQMSRPFYHELYDKKSCIAFMDKNPLIIDAASPLSDVADQTVITGDKSLTDGFIIMENERYIGIGLGIDLIKAVSEMHSQQHQQIMQSIEYARVLQEAMLTTSRQSMSGSLTDWCMVWEPRDCVGGDCYYFKAYKNGWLAVVADCTGHGVPGAFMTLIFASALEQALTQHGPEMPDLLLQAINRHIKNTLGQRSERRQQPSSNDGCDAILIFCDTTKNTLVWASAHMCAFLVKQQAAQVEILAADRMGVGYTDTPYDYCWPCHQLTLDSNDLFFTTTDGLTDQIGGERKTMFGKRRLQKILLHYQDQPMPAFANHLLKKHMDYQGDQVRRDDLTFWGFRHCSTLT
ncbi:protein-serine/threonine phosphatase [Brenneria goodwinii]|uniref:Protein-serine/threonine phosphatase n=1 Tax=Brenneria goodwinii TaxID=1109412 RepID=A0A0G4JPV6_9GAMM|nr:SpoIIE family protein phosphatase [Brenneria goodwinii]ATA24990.1 protein-serine/threonine phosphatase [Brenneria goodwinii]MCG8155541.1 SpoIIE family protein phosphatase [Brenneria goodwinii]MCG8160432.1 SpoIIE family protein phosphatase [Brenneria goodwinii]MCG8164955.1 SpoIIE family protein phosphatase [Brenneria goodwinii]MCG8169388.1 SpoIIE family protein phosphatase [Brenneria goodwinii]